MMLESLVACFRDAFLPYVCFYCHALTKKDTPLCGVCKNAIEGTLPFCIPISSGKVMQVSSLGAYKEPLKTFVLAKHSGVQAASEHLGILMAEQLELQKADALVPIPLHWKRYAARGFNQASTIAHVLSKAWQIPVVSLLLRPKETDFQSGLTILQRHENSSGAFMSNAMRAHWQSKSIILVDDLVTTGSTLRAAAEALEHLELNSLSAVVACRAV